MAKYTLASNGSVLRDDGAVIPPDPANSDYRDFLAWQAEGNVPDTPPPVPVTFTPRQIVQALKGMGNEKVQSALAAVDQLTLLEFSMASAVKEDDPRLLGVLEEIGVSLDSLKTAIKG